MRIVFDLLLAPIGAAVIWLLKFGKTSYKEIYWGKPEYTKIGRDPIARVRNGCIGFIVVLIIVVIIFKHNNPNFSFFSPK